MPSEHLLDPELQPLLVAIPTLTFDNDVVTQSRLQIEQNMQLVDADAAGIARQEIHIPGDDGGPDVRCLMYKPRANTNKYPAYLHFHGGGFVVGSAEGSDKQNVALAAALNIVVLAVSYRLAPEHDCVDMVRDGYTALAWLHENAKEHAIDTQSIAIGGESAGGGVAAATAILARDKGQYPICHQHLTYPMLDDRTGTSELPADPLVGEFIWTTENNAFGWQSYLGEQPPAAPHVPSRLKDFSGLPSTWISTASMDLFRDENIKYAEQLLKAGVPTEFVLYPGACHGFPLLPGTTIEKKYTRDHQEALARAFGLN